MGDLANHSLQTWDMRPHCVDLGSSLAVPPCVRCYSCYTLYCAASSVPVSQTEGKIHIVLWAPLLIIIVGHLVSIIAHLPGFNTNWRYAALWVGLKHYFSRQIWFLNKKYNLFSDSAYDTLSLESVNKRVFANFHDKNSVFTNFRDKNAVSTSFCNKMMFLNYMTKHSVWL